VLDPTSKVLDDFNEFINIVICNGSSTKAFGYSRAFIEEGNNIR
jgi:hypothetical protein